MENKGILKTNKAYSRVKLSVIKKIAICLFFVLGITAVGLGVGRDIAYNVYADSSATQAYMQTSEYQAAVKQETDKVWEDRYKNIYTLDEANEKAQYINSEEHAGEILMTSGNVELKNKKQKQDNIVNGLTTASTATCGASFAALAVAGLAIGMEHKSSKREDEEESQ